MTNDFYDEKLEDYLLNQDSSDIMRDILNDVRKGVTSMQKQYSVTGHNKGAIIELGDVDTKQYIKIANHPELNHIEQFLRSGVIVVHWSDDTNGQALRWINVVCPVDNLNLAIHIHKWSNGELTPLPDDVQTIAILDEMWYAENSAINALYW